jgi:hypothetical protein
MFLPTINAANLGMGVCIQGKLLLWFMLSCVALSLYYIASRFTIPFYFTVFHFIQYIGNQSDAFEGSIGV